MHILTTKEAAKELSKLLRRQKEFDESYIRKLIRLKKLESLRQKPPYLIELTHLQEFATRYEKALKEDNRTIRHFDK